MMQNLGTRGTWGQDSQRKLAFLRARKIPTVNRKHRHPLVEQIQFKDRATSLAEKGLPKFSESI